MDDTWRLYKCTPATSSKVLNGVFFINTSFRIPLFVDSDVGVVYVEPCNNTIHLSFISAVYPKYIPETKGKPAVLAGPVAPINNNTTINNISLNINTLSNPQTQQLQTQAVDNSKLIHMQQQLQMHQQQILVQ